MEERLQVIRKLWAEDDVTFNGEFFQLDEVTMSAKPIENPGPPIFVGADTLKSVPREREVGDHWIVSRRHSKSFLRQAVPPYRSALEGKGKEFKGLFMFRDLCVAGSTREAKQRVQEAYERMYQVYHQWGQPGERYDQDFEELKKERLIVGTPEEVSEQVMAYHREFVVEFMSLPVYWPGMNPHWAY